MMRVLYFAGLHLGLEIYNGVGLATGLSARLIDVLKALY
jgi:hypothetical protein